MTALKAHIEAAAIAREQVAWFRANGVEARDALIALGDRAARLRRRELVGWDDVFAALGAAWITLQARDALSEAHRRLGRYVDHQAELRP
jgi:hypothetical protein